MRLSLRSTAFIICLLSAICSARPPKVIRLFPENGAVDVKPGPCKIRILFDQDMTGEKNYSLCGGGDTFPELIGDPKWTGKRSFLMNAKLKPNHEYTFGINSAAHKNFKSASGEPAEVLVVTFRTSGPGGSQQSANPTAVSTDNRQAIHILRDNILHNYSYRDMKGLDWNALLAQYEQKLLDADSPEKFVSIAKLLLGKAQDKHIWFKVNGQTIPAYRKPVAPNANFQALPKLVPNFKKHNNTVSSGRFNDGVGYLAINSWSKSRENDLNAVFSVLDNLSDTRALIIDVRGNGGGSEPLARQVAGCFITEPKLYAKNINIDRINPGQFTDVYERYVQPNKSRSQYRGKVAILTGPVVMSSCEAFVLMMKQVPGCVLVGEPTQGSSGNPQPYDLGNGVTVYLPSWQTLLPDGTCFEGKGIRPDIPVKATSKGITTTDPVIETARKALMK
ncbi:MAG: S41 family peptidase [Planctomycetota bacterium]